MLDCSTTCSRVNNTAASNQAVIHTQNNHNANNDHHNAQKNPSQTLPMGNMKSSNSGGSGGYRELLILKDIEHLVVIIVMTKIVTQNYKKIILGPHSENTNHLVYYITVVAKAIRLTINPHIP